MSNYLYTLDNKILQHKGLTVDLVGAVVPVFPTSGLTYYWRFNEGTGTDALDAMGALNGTVSDAGIWTASGKRGAGLIPQNRYFVTGTWTVWTTAQPYTVSAWVKLAYLDGQVTCVLSNINGSTQDIIDIYIWNSGALSFSIMNGSSRHTYAVNPFITDSNWHHVVCCYNGDRNVSNSKVYLDGVYKAPTSSQNNLNAGTFGLTKLQVGRRNTTVYNTTSVQDEVAVWNRVLTQDEVTTLYNSGTGLFY